MPRGITFRLFLISSPTSVADSIPRNKAIIRGTAENTPVQPFVRKGVKRETSNLGTADSTNNAHVANKRNSINDWVFAANLTPKTFNT